MRKNKYELILKEAASLIGRKGYKSTSFQEIADRVGIHKSTLFHYFDNKEQLLRLILERSIEAALGKLEEVVTDEGCAPAEKLARAIRNHLSLLVDYMDNVNAYLNEFRNLSEENQAIYLKKRKSYERGFRTIVLQMQKEGYFAGLDPKIVTFGILGMLNWTAKWFKRDGNLSVEEVADTFFRMIVGKG